MKSKREKNLIINADDFGLHESINEAIEITYRQGILTNTSFVVNGEAFGHAVEIAKRNRGLAVGLHLTLFEEKPVCSPDKIKSIVDADGKLHEDHLKLCINILRKKVLLKDIVTELEAQFNKFYKTGLTPSHIDSHRHVHLFPPIFNSIRPVLQKYKAKRMRYLNIPYFDFKRGGYLKKSVALFFKYYGQIKNNSCRHQDYYLGFFDGGRLDKDQIIYLLRRLKPGVTEINFHPGVNNQHLREKYKTWKKYSSYEYDWEREFRILLDPDLKALIKDNKITLVNYAAI